VTSAYDPKRTCQAAGDKRLSLFEGHSLPPTGGIEGQPKIAPIVGQIIVSPGRASLEAVLEALGASFK